MERSFLDDVGAVAVFADQLEEEGDPRAELVRAQLAGDALRARELIRTHWPVWLGPIDPKESLLTWKHGFVIDAALRKVPGDETLATLLERPALRFLQRLALGPFSKVALTGLDWARSLRTLVWLTSAADSAAPLAGLKLRHLETLTLDLKMNQVDALSTLQLPALSQLLTGCTAANEAAILRALAAASWWPTLTQWTHRVQSREGLLALQGCAPLVARGGRGFVALCHSAVLGQVPSALRQALPLAEFRLLRVPEPAHDPDDSNGPAEVDVAPVEGRMDFRELTGWTTKSERSTQNEHGTDGAANGPGVPFKELNHWGSEFTSCGWCGSDDTRCIHSKDWSMYSHYETTTFKRWEYECGACGLFTRMRSMTTR